LKSGVYLFEVLGEREDQAEQGGYFVAGIGEDFKTQFGGLDDLSVKRQSLGGDGQDRCALGFKIRKGVVQSFQL
jgi:hypothetical protein